MTDCSSTLSIPLYLMCTRTEPRRLRRKPKVTSRNARDRDAAVFDNGLRHTALVQVIEIEKRNHRHKVQPRTLHRAAKVTLKVGRALKIVAGIQAKYRSTCELKLYSRPRPFKYYAAREGAGPRKDGDARSSRNFDKVRPMSG